MMKAAINETEAVPPFVGFRQTAETFRLAGRTLTLFCSVGTENDTIQIKRSGGERCGEYSVSLCPPACVRDIDEIQLDVLHNIILVTTSVILFICFLSGDSSLEHFAY